MTAYFGIWYTGSPRIVDHIDNAAWCEMDGGICYEAFTSFADAAAAAADTLTDHQERYVVRAMPAGIKVWNRETESLDVTTRHLTRRDRKAARKLLQRPYRMAAQHRADAFAYLDQMAKYRASKNRNPELARAYCVGYNRAARNEGFYLP